METIFKSFDSDRNSVEMLTKLLTYSNFSVINQKVFRLPLHCTVIE
jgi:hypothetical protein